MSDTKTDISGLKGEDIMTAQAYSVTTDMTVKEVISELIDRKISGAAVVDNMKTVISVISEVDLMKFAAGGGVGRKIGEFMDKLVSPEKILKVQKKDSFKDIFKHFLLNPVRRVIVVDSADKIQGIISRRDILKAFLSVEAAKDEEKTKDEAKE